MYFLQRMLLLMYVRSSSPAAFVRLLTDTVTQQLQTDYTIGANVGKNPYHVPIVRSQLTQALPLLVPEVYDEVVTSCNEFIPVTKGNRLNHQNMLKNKLDNSWTEWQSVRVMDAIMKVVCRASNWIFVGLPLCTWLLWSSIIGTLCLELCRQELGLCRPQCSIHSGCYKGGHHSSNDSWLFETVSYEIAFFNYSQLP